MTAPHEPDRVKVRMYKGLLGDCLLVTLEAGEGADATASHILIDCGVLQGTLGARKIMNEVVDDIFATTGDKGLDLVVVTHEHHDHISGFAFAAERFAKGPIGRVWMAWTENPGDPDGIAFQERFGKGFAILGSLGETIKVPDRPTVEGDKTWLGLAGFSGPLAEQVKAGSRSERGSRKIYRNLKRWARDVQFLSPGNVLPTPGSLGLRTYVLGPPRDMAMLTKALPTAAKPETYFGAAPDGLPERDLNAPFPRFPILKADAVKAAAGQAASDETLCFDRYYASSGIDTDFDLASVQAHRRIDDNARSVFATLALKMDNNTNNTSLVLAFDLPDDAGTLLFAADAQVGNWLSWDKVAFREKPGDEPLPVTAADLLARTRLYKVGHHGSHNATLKDKGLGQMNGRDFVAMVPTDAEFAKEQSSGWLMPNPRVEAALLAKGLVLRGDRTLGQSLAERGKRLDTDAAKALKSWAKKRIDDSNPLYVEYTVYDRARDAKSH